MKKPMRADPEQKYRTLYESTSDAVMLLNERNFFDCNPATLKIFGCTTREQFLGKHPSRFSPEFQPGGQASASLSQQRIETALREGTCHFEWLHCRLDGAEFPAEVLLTAMNIGGEKVLQAIVRDITERRRAEAALQESEERFRSVVENSPTGIFIVDNAYEFMYANDELCQIIGYAREEIIGSDFQRFLDEESRQIVADRYVRRQRGEDIPPRYEFNIVRKNGEKRRAEISSTVIKDLAGNVQTVGQILDITERKRAEAALRESEERFRRFSEVTTEGLVFHEQGKIIDANAALVAMFGYSDVSEIVGKGLLEFIAPEVRAAVLKQLQSGSTQPYEALALRKDGAGFPVEASGRTYEFQGHTIRVGNLHDITERKRAEEALRESQQLIQTVMDNIPQSIFWKDKNLVYLGCNRAFAADAGLASPSDALGKTDWDMPWKEQAELYRADDSRVMESGVPKLNYEEPQTTPDGSTIWLRTSKVPMRDTQGNVTAVLGMYEDITERKRLEQQIRDSAERRGYQVQTSAEVAQEIAAAPALDELFRRVVTLIKERFGYYHAQIFHYEPALNAVVLVSGYGEAGKKMLAAGHRLEMGRGVVGTAAITGQPALATDITQDQDWRPNPNLPETKGELAVPIKLRDQVLGILDVQSDQAGALTAEDQLLLEGLCGQIAVAIEDTRLRQQMEERLRELDTLYRATSREGWETFRQAAESPSGYLFDRTVIQPAEDLWTPEIARAVEQQALVSPVPSRVAVSKAQESPNGGATVAPLSVRGEVVGALGVYDDPQHPMSSDDLALVESVSEQVALALESARLYEEARARAEELSTLNDIGRQLSSALSLEDLYRVVHQQVSRLFDTTSFFIGTYEAGSDHWQMAYHIEERRPSELGPRSLKAGFGSHMIKTQKPLMINTAQEMEDFVQAQNITRVGPSAKAWLGVPLIAAGQVVGVMAVQSYSQENIYTPRSLALFSMIGNQAAIAIQNARLFEQTQAALSDTQMLNDISARFNVAASLEDVLEAAASPGITAGASSAGIWLFESDASGRPEWMEFVATWVREGEPVMPLGTRIRLTDFPSQKIWLNDSGQPTFVNNIASDERVDLLLRSTFERTGIQAVAFMPLVIGSDWVGITIVSWQTLHLFTASEQQLYKSIAAQAAVAIENRRLLEQTRARAEELAALNELSQRLTARFDVAGVLEEAYRGATRLLDTANFSLALYDEDKDEIRFPLDVYEGQRLDEDMILLSSQGMTGYIIRNREPVLIKEDAVKWRAERGIEPLGSRLGAQSWLGVPMIVGDRTLGALIVQSYTTPHAFNEHSQDMLAAIANQTAIALQNARLFEETSVRAKELAILNEMSRTLSAMLDREAVIKSVYQNTSHLMNTTNFYVALYDSRKDEVSFPFYAEGERIRALQGRRRTGKGLTEYVIRTREPLLIEENVSARLYELGIESIGQESQSWLGTPMLVGDQVVGVLAVQSYTTPRLYNPHHRDLLYAIASQTAVILENTRLFEEARTRAEEMAVLNELAQTLSTRLDVDQVLQETYRGLSRLMDTTNFYIGLYAPEKNEVSFPINVSESILDQQISVIPADQGMTGYIIRNRTSVLIKDDVTEWHKKMGMETVGEIALSWLGVPLMIGDQMLGVMAVQSYTTPGLYNEHDRDLLTAFASQTAIAIQNARLFEQTRAALAEVEATHRRYLHEQWETFLAGAAERTLSYVDGPAGLVPAGDESLATTPASATGGLAVPIRLRGESIGVLEFSDEDASRAWSEDEQALVEVLADQAALALENARLFEETQSRAQREQLINEITARVRASTNIETILRTTAEELSRTLNLPRARIRLGSGNSNSNQPVIK